MFARNIMQLPQLTTRSYYEGGGEKREERKKERCRWFFSQTVEKEY